MPRSRWLLLLALLVAGGVLGAGAMLVSLEVNKATSTDEFCTSCHSMKFVGNDPHFQASAHRSNSEGVNPTCADCHIPKTNWFVETYTHVTSGVRDVIAEYTHNYSDPRDLGKAPRRAGARSARRHARAGFGHLPLLP